MSDNRKQLVHEILKETETFPILRQTKMNPGGLTYDRIGDILLLKGKISTQDLLHALEMQKEEKDKDERLGMILLKRNLIKEGDLFEALAEQYGMPFVADINIEKMDIELIRNIPINFCKRFKLIPIERRSGFIHIVTADPMNTAAIDDLKVMLRGNAKIFTATESLITDIINKAYDRATASADVVGELDEDMEGFDIDEPKDLLDTDDEAPIIRLVNSLLTRAVKEGTSDIHIEPFEKEISVRFRVDGALSEVATLPKQYQASVASRVKILAKLNIAEKRIPQDGRIQIKIAGKDIDIRLSTLPTAHGERLVMRLLDRSSVLVELRDLGFEPQVYNKLNQIIHKPHGIFLVTGPTGSGKTTTLYSCLTHIHSVEKNIITVEDPVEYQLKGINQIQVNAKVNMTFANGLRAILRQDPDVIMVGEIRDGETAEIAVNASLTGHMVLSTIHTNDSFGVIARMIDMGVEPFLISSSIDGVLAQRLVRKVCLDCRREVKPTQAELDVLEIKMNDLKDGIIYHANGCPKCSYSGYRGRMGIYELLPIDDEIRAMILQQNDSVSLKRVAVARGMKLLRDDGKRRVINGDTTIEEVLKVTQVDTSIE